MPLNLVREKMSARSDGSLTIMQCGIQPRTSWPRFAEEGELGSLIYAVKNWTRTSLALHGFLRWTAGSASISAQPQSGTECVPNSKYFVISVRSVPPLHDLVVSQ